MAVEVHPPIFSGKAEYDILEWIMQFDIVARSHRGCTMPHTALCGEKRVNGVALCYFCEGIEVSDHRTQGSKFQVQGSELKYQQNFVT